MTRNIKNYLRIQDLKVKMRHSKRNIMISKVTHSKTRSFPLKLHLVLSMSEIIQNSTHLIIQFRIKNSLKKKLFQNIKDI